MDSVSRVAIGVSRRSYVTVSSESGSHSARVYRVPLSTANVLKAARQTSGAANQIFIFLPGSAMKKLSVHNGDVVNIAIGRGSSASDSSKVSAQPVTSGPRITARGSGSGKTLLERIKQDVIPGLGDEFTTTDIANVVGKAPGDISKQIRALVDSGFIRVSGSTKVNGRDQRAYKRVS